MAPALGKDESRRPQLLGWSAPPFEIPDNIRSLARHPRARQGLWTERSTDGTRAAKRGSTATLAARWPGVAAPSKRSRRKASEGDAAQATRISSQKRSISWRIRSNLIGGSADLTGSNNTKAADMRAVTPDDFSGRYIHYGVREFGMAAAMNGITLHGGFIPYGGTFLVFADYAAPPSACRAHGPACHLCADP